MSIHVPGATGVTLCSRPHLPSLPPAFHWSSLFCRSRTLPIVPQDVLPAERTVDGSMMNSLVLGVMGQRLGLLQLAARAAADSSEEAFTVINTIMPGGLPQILPAEPDSQVAPGPRLTGSSLPSL
ncbi:unnamed protein product [Pleuronectes platessa]|uniref:Uncharacterized protein n=1 Tax=Pleuronectes platessa TaxID=8262 RepID=A0A9N7YGM4_PLEPL|nr:unnamed protein product [Pleuronectes platessa]